MENKNIQKRREKLMKSIKDDSIVVLFAGREVYKSADEMYDFTPNRNFYYLTGINAPNIILLISKRNGEVSEDLFIERPDPVMARWVGEKYSREEAEEASKVTNIDYVENFSSYIAALLNRYDFENVYLDLERQEYNIPKTFSQKFAGLLIEKYPYIKVNNIYSKICSLRVIKDKQEIDLMRKAIEITKEGILNMVSHMTPDMMEYEIEAYFDYSLRKNGINDKAFKTIAASGKNATVLHYSENNCKAMKDSLILFDLGAQYKYYNGDISRTFPLSGKFTQRQKDIYNVVLETNLAIASDAKPGLSLLELNNLSKKYLADGCRKLGLIKEDSELSKYYFHSIGHYLGLDTHDVGDRLMKMEKGMVITNEPGLYIPEEGIGIRVEDDLLITDSGCEVLSKDILKTPEDIENFMK